MQTVYFKGAGDVEARLPVWIDPELSQAPPRTALLSSQGRHRLLAATAPVAALLALGAWLFFSRPQPGWMTGPFSVFVACCVAVLWRLLALWQARFSLVRSGIAASAVVISKEEAHRGAARYYAWYQAGGRQWGIGFAGGGNDAEIGDVVTVLHAPDRPAEAVVYRGSGCAVRPFTPRI